MVGTVVTLEDGSFGVSNQLDGPTYCVLADPWIGEVKIGDRVEIKPRFSTTVGGRWNARSIPEWVLIQKLGPS